MACHCHSSVVLGLAADTGPMPFHEPGVGPHYAPSREVRIEHAAIRLSLEPARRTFAGEGRYRLRALPGYRGRFGLDVEEIEVLAVEDGAGRALPWSHDDAQLRVRCDRVPDEVVVRWRGKDPSRGLYFTGPTAWAPDRQHMAWTQFQDEDGHFVLPCHDHPGTKHSWRIELDAPAGYTLLSNGRLVESGERDGRAFAVYVQEEPMPAYLFTAVAARLTAIEASNAPVPVRYLVPTGEEEAVARSMGKTPLMIRAFAERLGVPFPWPRYDQVVVHDFIFGGMENVACTTMTDILLVDEKGIVEFDPDGLVAHELAHQWFGDLVTCQDWSQGWLNESWATYMEAVWWEHDRDEAEATWYRWTTMGQYFQEAGTRYQRPIVDYRFREPIDVFDAHLYQKGSCVLWTLRRRLGEEGFWAGVRAYLERHREGSVHTRDFQRAFEQTTGRNLDGFFDQWVHSPGHPQIEVQLGTGDGLLTVGVQQKQSGDGVPEVYEFDLRLVVVFEDGTERTVDLPIRERQRTWAIPVDGEIGTVRVDPGLGVLADLNVRGPEGWLVRLLSDPCPTVAVRAAKGLLDTGAPRGFDAVARALGAHPFHGVRSTLAGAIGAVGGPKARDVLLEALRREEDPRVRRAIVDALGQFRDTAVADALVELLKEELPTWHLEGAALAALGRTRDPRAREILTSRLDVDSWNRLVPQRALAGLGATEDPAVLDILLDRASADRPDRVRAAAALALGRLADAVESTRHAAVERLVEMCAEPGFRSRLAAIQALGSLRDPRGVGALDRLHRTAPDGRMRRLAYEALARVRQGRTTEEGLAPLRRRLDELAEENGKLRARIEKLEGAPKD